MISKNNKNINQIELISIDELVPENHLLRKIDKYVEPVKKFL